jgi:hypothetical protein|tara:strand:+ start:1655 stop:2092 length:438 start_codon:yes stop_codon:yes gene_type:complete
MNNLRGIYEAIKAFGESHRMINEVLLVKSEEELEGREFKYRTMVMMPLEANISREQNAPAYYVEFGIVILDKVPSENDEATINSVDENIFIVGQLQDHLEQSDYFVEFGSVDLGNESIDDYNITTAIADFTFTLARKPYNRGINL